MLRPVLFHYVSTFLSKFSWKDGVVGGQLRLEPAKTIEDLKQLACKYHMATMPVKYMGEILLPDLLIYWIFCSARHPRWVKFELIS